MPADRSRSTGSRTAGYVLCGLMLPLVVMVPFFLLTPTGAIAGLVTLWATGIVWLLKKRSEDPEWDRRL